MFARMFFKGLCWLLICLVHFSDGKVVCTKRYDFSENQGPCETYDTENCETPHIPPSCPVTEIINRYPCLRYICVEKDTTTAIPRLVTFTTPTTESIRKTVTTLKPAMLFTTEDVPETERLDALELLNVMKEKLKEAQKLKDRKHQELLDWWEKNRIDFNNQDPNTFDIMLVVAIFAGLILLLILWYTCCKKRCLRPVFSDCQNPRDPVVDEPAIARPNVECGAENVELVPRNFTNYNRYDLNENGSSLQSARVRSINSQNLDSVSHLLNSPNPVAGPSNYPPVVAPSIDGSIPCPVREPIAGPSNAQLNPGQFIPVQDEAAQPDFNGFNNNDDSSDDDILNSEYWRGQLASEILPDTDEDDATYSPSHTQIFIPEVRRRSVRNTKTVKKLDL